MTFIFLRYLKYVIVSEKHDFSKIYACIKSCFNDLNSFTINNNDELNNETSDVDITFSQLIIVEYLLKYCRTNRDKYFLLKHLIALLPANFELFKWFTNYLFKESSAKYALQYLYDHLIINSITNDSLWIL